MVDIGWITFGGIVGVSTIIFQWLLQVQYPLLKVITENLELKVQKEIVELAGELHNVSNSKKQKPIVLKIRAAAYARNAHSEIKTHLEKNTWICTVIALVCAFVAAIVDNTNVKYVLVAIAGLLMVVVIGYAVKISGNLEKLDRYMQDEDAVSIFADDISDE